MNIHYLQHAKVCGASNLELKDEDIPAMFVDTMRDALTKEHETDAHFVCYSLATGDDLPRLKKVCLPHVRSVGDDVICYWIAIDVDNYDHARWNGEMLASFFEVALPTVGDGTPENPGVFPFNQACAWYTTRAGCRFLFRLSEPLSPEEWEPKSQGLVKLFREAGWNADERCKDWTRLFRLPNVNREGVNQGSEPWAYLDIREDLTIDPNGIPSAGPAAKREERLLDVPKLCLDMPDEDSATFHFEKIDKNGKMTLTTWGQEVKKRLRGQEYFPALFDHVPLADKGSRDETLFRVVSSIVSLTYDWMGTTPTHVLGLVQHAVKGFTPDSGTPNWRKSLWDKILWCWAKEKAKIEAKKIELEEKEVERQSDMAQIVEGMMKWLPDPRLKVNADGTVPPEAIEVVQKHLVCVMNTGHEHFVLDKTGRYFSMPVTSRTVIPHVRKLLGEDIIDTRIQMPSGGVRDMTPTDLTNHYATIIGEISYEAGEEEGGFIREVGTPSARISIVPFSRSKALTPLYNEDVDHWLKICFGHQFPQVCKWIAWALAFEEGPICALSIVGPSGCGKSLFTEGLAETLRVPNKSTFDDLTSAWQYNLAKSPWVFADEGLGTSMFSKSHPSDVFRRIIGKSDNFANRKNLAPVHVSVDLRLVMTANNFGTVRALTSDKELTPEDRSALLVRLMHVDGRQEASDWLQSMGGRNFTRGWISDGRSSRYIVARHFLWIYQNRHQYGRDMRLLVEGGMDHRVMAQLRMHGGMQDRVIEAVILILSLPPNNKRRGKTQVGDGRAYILAGDVHTYISMEMGYKNIKVSQVREALRSIILPDTLDEEGNPKMLKLGDDQYRYHQLDLDFLISAAYEYGWNTEALLQAKEGILPRMKQVPTKVNLNGEFAFKREAVTIESPT